jgi:hypothetical protein
LQLRDRFGCLLTRRGVLLQEQAAAVEAAGAQDSAWDAPEDVPAATDIRSFVVRPWPE